MPLLTQRFIAGPENIPASTYAISGKSSRRRVYSSLRVPVDSARCSSPLVAATSIARCTLARHAAVLKGCTIPVLPRMLMPPSTPSRALVVCSAISTPPGTEIRARTPVSVGHPHAASPSPTASAIIRRGTRVTAGSPTAMPVPGRVTVPTPGPPAISSPWYPSGSRHTPTTISAPCVTSGSSPPSLITEQRTPSAGDTGQLRCTLSVAAPRPPGSGTDTSSGACPDSISITAALAAAAAVVPVV